MNEDISYVTVSTQCEPRKNYDESIIVSKRSFSDGEESNSEDDEIGNVTQIEPEKCIINVTVKMEEDIDKKRPNNGVEHRVIVSKKQKLEDNKYKNITKRFKSDVRSPRPGFSEERYNETSYFMENGLRKVYPYYFTFTTFTKGRWVGEKLLNVLAGEFRSQPVEAYERYIEEGTLTVNKQKVAPDYEFKHNDLLANTVHRHEVPVTSGPINIVYIDKDIVVVNKPASIPVHPCGRYRHNTVVFILAKEYNLKNLRTLHRLDRLTSGLLLFGRTSKRACLIEHQMRNRQVDKEYICRVEGNFPDDEVVCNEPIKVVSYKIGVCRVAPDGKHCSTTFQKLGFNGQTSIISCKPSTGRMHQIRVHLQFLGYPIINDPLYNHSVFGPEKGKGGNFGKTDDELIKQLISIHNAENWLGLDKDPAFSLPEERKPTSENETSERQSEINVKDPAFSLGDERKPTSENEVSERQCEINNAKDPAFSLADERKPTSENETSERQCEINNVKDPAFSLADERIPTSENETSERQCEINDIKDPAFSLADERKPTSENETSERQCEINDVKDPTFSLADERKSTSENETSERQCEINDVKDPAFSLADERKPTSANETSERQCEVNDIKSDSSGWLNVPAPASVVTELDKNVHEATQPNKVSVSIQTGYEPADLSFDSEKLIKDDHCFECKAVYRDPKPKDLIMFLHAWKYEGPGWSYKTELPYWAKADWKFQD